MKLNRKLRKLSILHNKAFLQVFVLLIAVFVVSVLWSKFSKYALPSKSMITSDQLNQIKPASFKPSKALFKERKNALKKYAIPTIDLAPNTQVYRFSKHRLLTKSVFYKKAETVYYDGPNIKGYLRSISINKLSDAYYLNFNQDKHLYFEHNSVLTFNKDSRKKNSDLYRYIHELGKYNPAHFSKIDDVATNDDGFHGTELVLTQNGYRYLTPYYENGDTDKTGAIKLLGNYDRNLLYKDPAEDGNQTQLENWHSKYQTFSYKQLANNLALRQAHFNDYDWQTIQKHEWHPVSYTDIMQKVDSLHPVIYYHLGNLAYYLPLVKFNNDYFYPISYYGINTGGYYVKARDVLGINGYPLTVYNAPVKVKTSAFGDQMQKTYHEIEHNDPYNYRLNYAYLANKKQEASVYPAGRVIDETKYARHLKGSAVYSSAIANVVNQNLRIDRQVNHQELDSLADSDNKWHNGTKVVYPSKDAKNLQQKPLDKSDTDLIAPFYEKEFCLRNDSYNRLRVNEKNQYLNQQKAKLAWQKKSNDSVILNDSNFLPDDTQNVAQHLLVKSFGYTNIDPKPTNPFSRYGTGYDPIRRKNLYGDATSDKSLASYNDNTLDDPLISNNYISYPNRNDDNDSDYYVTTGLTHWKQWINLKTKTTLPDYQGGISWRAILDNGRYTKYPTPAKGLYLKFGIGNGQKPDNVTYPFNKTLYLQSIVRNSIKGRHNEFYLITCYDQKTINSTRRWTYPIMNSKDVQLSDIVEHKNIATHYDNFLDTSILAYHMMDFERYNKYRNAYRFIRDPQTDFSSPVQEIAGTPDSKTTKETVYDAILPPIDTAQENLNNETGKKVATQIQNSVNDYKKRWKGCSTVDDVFNLSHNTTSYVLPSSDDYLK